MMNIKQDSESKKFPSLQELEEMGIDVSTEESTEKTDLFRNSETGPVIDYEERMKILSINEYEGESKLKTIFFRIRDELSIFKDSWWKQLGQNVGDADGERDSIVSIGKKIIYLIIAISLMFRNC